MVGNSAFAPFFRGDTKTYTLTFKDGTGRAIDVSGHELWFTMKRQITDPDSEAVLQKRVVFADNEASRAGSGMLVLDSTETGAVEPGTYWCDLQKVVPGSPPVVATLLSGKIAVLPDVTRRDAG